MGINRLVLRKDVAIGECTTGRKTLFAHVKMLVIVLMVVLSDYALVTADYAVKVPEGLNPAQASSITCAELQHIKPLKKLKLNLVNE